MPCPCGVPNGAPRHILDFAHAAHSAAIAQSFAASAPSYDAHAELQRAVAARLARLLPDLVAPRVLELGCGTGLFSRHLIARYPDGRFTFSDLAPAMLEQCRQALAPSALPPSERVRFKVIDAGRLNGEGDFDLIALSMTLHWLPDPPRSAAALARPPVPQGRAPLRHPWVRLLCRVARRARARSLAERARRDAAAPRPRRRGTPCVRRRRALLPARDEGGGRGHAAAGLPAAAPGALRRAIRTLDARHGGRVTWHIVYGCLRSSG